MDPESVSKQIGYRLGQLSADNAHHRFEDLCRHLASARIAINILPATGPVASGGDQGRDFETFESWLHGERDPGDGRFAARVSDKRLVFACSLQKNIVPKIRSDVKKIAAGAVRFHSVHFFCTEDVPVSKRHELQDWAKEDHDLSLEIYDKQGIAHLLAAKDTIWIAIKFLDLDPSAAEVFGTNRDDGARETAARIADYAANIARRPFVGRGEELARLDALVARGGGRAVITGRAGYGKTLLAVQWISILRQRGVRVAYHLFKQAHGSASRDAAGDVSIAYASLALQVTDMLGRDASHGSLRHVVREYDGAEPLVIVLDGLDEAASDPEDPLEGLLPPNVTVVASIRSDQLAFRPKLRTWTTDAEIIDLQRLSYDAVMELLRIDRSERVRSLASDRALMETLERMAKGFPLYLGYLIDDLRDGLVEGKDPQAILSGTPLGFVDYVRDRARLLIETRPPEDELRVLAALSVANGLLPIRLLCEVANVDETTLAALPPRTARWLVFSYAARGYAHYGFQHDLLAVAFRSTLALRITAAAQAIAEVCFREASARRAESYVARNVISHLVAVERWTEILVLASQPAFLEWQRAVAGSNLLSVTTLQAAATAAMRLSRPAEAAGFLVRAGYDSESSGMETALEAARAGDVDEIPRLLGSVVSLRVAIAYTVCALELARSGRVSHVRDLLSRMTVSDRSAWPIPEEADDVLPTLLAQLAAASPVIAAEMADKLLQPSEQDLWLRLAMRRVAANALGDLVPRVRSATDKTRLEFVQRAAEAHDLPSALEICALVEDRKEASEAAARAFARLSPEERQREAPRFEPFLSGGHGSFVAMVIVVEKTAGHEQTAALIEKSIRQMPETGRWAILVDVLTLEYEGIVEAVPGITFDTTVAALANSGDVTVQRGGCWQLALAAAGRHPDFVRCGEELLRLAREHPADEDDDTAEHLARLLSDEGTADSFPLADALEAAPPGKRHARMLTHIARWRQANGDADGALRIVQELKATRPDLADRVSIARTEHALGCHDDAAATVDSCLRDVLSNARSADENFIELLFKNKHLHLCSVAYADIGRMDASRNVLELIDSFAVRIAAATSLALTLFRDHEANDALQLLIRALHFTTRSERVTEVVNLLVNRSGDFAHRGKTALSLLLLEHAEGIIHRAGAAPRWNPLLWRIHLLQRVRGAEGPAAKGFERAYALLEKTPPSVERRKIAREAIEDLLSVNDGAEGSLTMVTHFDGRSRDPAIDTMSHLLLRDLSRELGPSPDTFMDNFREPYDLIRDEPAKHRKSNFARELAILFWRLGDRGDRESQAALLREALVTATDPLEVADIAATACWTGCHEWAREVFADLPGGPFADVMAFDLSLRLLAEGQNDDALQKASAIRDSRIKSRVLRQIATKSGDAVVRQSALAAFPEVIAQDATRATPLMEHAVAAAANGLYDVAWSALTAASEIIDCRRERPDIQKLLALHDK